jgi:hypothetical protein
MTATATVDYAFPVRTFAALARNRFVYDLRTVEAMGGTSYLKQPDKPWPWLAELFPEGFDSWRLLFVAQVLEDLAHADDPDSVEVEHDTDFHELMAWLASDERRLMYCDKAVEDAATFGLDGEPNPFMSMLMQAQYLERSYVLEEVLGALKRVAAQLMG